MTPEELEFLETVPFYDRFSKRTDDSTPAPATSTTPPPATTLAEDDKAFMKQCAGEAVRLGWAPDKESLKTAIVVANKTFFGNFIPSADMTPGQKEQFLERLREMTPGQAYGEIGTAPMEDAPLNLDEDVDFF